MKPTDQRFTLLLDQQAKLKAWIQQRPACPVGAIGGRYTYEFTPTGLGVVCKVRDSVSGAVIDLTEYDEW